MSSVEIESISIGYIESEARDCDCEEGCGYCRAFYTLDVVMPDGTSVEAAQEVPWVGRGNADYPTTFLGACMAAIGYQAWLMLFKTRKPIVLCGVCGTECVDSDGGHPWMEKGTGIYCPRPDCLAPYCLD